MRQFLYTAIFSLFFLFIRAQVLPPYIQTFDSLQCSGWSHGAIAGTDDWQRGVPTGTYLNSPASTPNVWATNLNGPTTAFSIMYLQTPSFNLSNLTKVYLLTFLHQYETYSYHGGNIDYSIDNGQTWQILNGTASQKLNWYNNTACSGMNNEPTWSFNQWPLSQSSAHSLIALQGQANVKFRFKYGGSSNPQEGWMIDNFSIVENVPNVVALPGITYNATKNFAAFSITSSFCYNGLFPPTFTNTTNYYFSYDSLFTAADVLIGTKTQVLAGSVPAWTQTFAMVPNLVAGKYFIFYMHDFNNNLAEGSETDNTSYSVLNIDSTFVLPHVDNFELTNHWKTPGGQLYWIKGLSNIHQAEGTHSGLKSWYIKNPQYQFAPNTEQFITSPYLDMTSSSNNVICFWYRAKNTYTYSPSKLQVQVSGTNSQPAYNSTLTIPFPRFNNWDCNCQSLSMLNGQNNAKVRFRYLDGTTYSVFDQNMNVDDIYIGAAKPDLSIEHKNILSTPASLASDTLHYRIFNGGAATASISLTQFYWSTDSILDGADPLIASVNENSLVALGYAFKKIVYTKPTAALGNYFIIYKTDANTAINEMWESNNIGYYKLKQVAAVQVPYFNDFETQATGWWHNASIGTDSWKLSTPNGSVLSSAFSGSMAFTTATTTPLPAMSRMHLYTPVFDFTSITNPVMEFNLKLHSDQACHCFEGKMNMSYSMDGGSTWMVLDTLNNSFTRWYYPMDYDDWGGIDKDYYLANYSQLFLQGSESAFATFQQYNSRDTDGNTSYIIDINQFAGKPHVQFRFNLASAKNDTTNNYIFEGAVIDNFRIRNRFIDLAVPVKKHLMLSSVSQKIKFNMHIKNKGNFISTKSINKFYVSADTILDPSDFYLGVDTIKWIRPNMKRYCNLSFNGPSNLSGYNYLMYELDATNLNAESVESNNIGHWPLSRDSVDFFPYVQNFNDTILHGWNEYATLYNNLMRYQWRSRNMIAFGESIYQTQAVSGQLFTDRMTPVANIGWVPFWYVETPAFNFMNYTSLQLSFNLMVVANNNSGANFEYSTNGGNTWAVLQPTLTSQAYNWYNNFSIPTLNNEPGWSMFIVPNTLLDSVHVDLGFLSGQPNVVFRYKFHANAAPAGNGTFHGMRIDNFKITGVANLVTSVPNQDNGLLSLYVYENNVYVNNQTHSEDRNYTLSLYNMLGQVITTFPVELNTGGNTFKLPATVSNGMYLVDLSNGKKKVQQKIILMRN